MPTALCVCAASAQAGEIAAMVAGTLGCPMVFTGHSLGRNKLDNVLRSGRMTRAEAESVYKISRRRATVRIAALAKSISCSSSCDWDSRL